jgi:hypothetical protein
MIRTEMRVTFDILGLLLKGDIGKTTSVAW